MCGRELDSYQFGAQYTTSEGTCRHISTFVRRIATRCRSPRQRLLIADGPYIPVPDGTDDRSPILSPPGPGLRPYYIYPARPARPRRSTEEREKERGMAIVVATYFTVARRPQINAWLYNVEICATSFYDPATRHARRRRRSFCRRGSSSWWSGEIDSSTDWAPAVSKYKVNVSSRDHCLRWNVSPQCPTADTLLLTISEVYIFTSKIKINYTARYYNDGIFTCAQNLTKGPAKPKQLLRVN